MHSESLNQYVSLRDSIFAERKELISRLQEIEAVLGRSALHGGAPHHGLRTPTGRARNEMSLKEAVLRALKEKPLTKHEILDAVLAMGYQFSTIDPLNSLGVILYGRNSKFKRVGGKFSL